METIGGRGGSDWTFYLVEGMIVRSDPKKETVQIRNFLTSEWVKAKDPKTIGKVQIGHAKKLGCDSKKADALFQQLKLIATS